MSASGLGRKFHFIREIASGGFGSVYLAKVIHGDGFARLAAIKLLHPKWSENEEIASRMRDEARLLGWLRHKHIVEVLDLTRIGGRVAVIMEYLEAVDAKLIVNWAIHDQREIPVNVCLEICAAVASALDAAYNRPPYAGEKPLRVIHRDIKPSNIMVDTSGTVKVLDFGVARADFAERESHTQEMSFGSIEYMPPERLFFEPDTDKSDVYSLGVTLYEMLALEKFGKARLRYEQMEDWFEERWTSLRQKRTFPSPDVEMDVRLLLHDMLAFESAERPSAADCAACMRTVARRCGTEPIGEFAEVVIPPLVQAFHNRVREKTAESLVDQTISEDSRGFQREDDHSDIGAPALPVSDRDPRTEEEESDELDISGRMNDEQWARLKRATIADIEEQTSAITQGTPIPQNRRTPDPVQRSLPPPQKSGALPPPQKSGSLPPPQKSGALPPPQKSGALPQKPQASQIPDALRKKTPPPPPSRSGPVPASAMRQYDDDDDDDEPRGVEPVVAKTGVWTNPRRSQPDEDTVQTQIQPDFDPPDHRSGRGAAIEDQPRSRLTDVLLPVFMLAAFALVVLCVVGVLLTVVGAGIATQGGHVGVEVAAAEDTTPEPESTTPEPEATPDPPVTAPSTSAKASTSGKPVRPVGWTGATFTSQLPNMKKLTVRCNTGSGEGVGSAQVEGKEPGECTVTAVDTDRKRMVAVIKPAEPKDYVCFAEGVKECK